jgi:hypothetical protein
MVEVDIHSKQPLREPMMEVALSIDELAKASPNEALHQANLFQDYLYLSSPFYYNILFSPAMSNSSQNHAVFLHSYQPLNAKNSKFNRVLIFLISTIIISTAVYFWQKTCLILVNQASHSNFLRPKPKFICIESSRLSIVTE